MLFNSYIFVLAFLPITLIVYYLLGKWEKYDAAKYFLVVASLVFYAYNNVYYLLIICVSLAANYLISLGMVHYSDRTNPKRLLLAAALVVNLGILFYFKYFDFFLENVNLLFRQSFNYLNIVLPLGISFYTFQQISYVVDVYAGKAKEYTFVDYALFVTFFPQLIAGPIALHSEMIPQFQNRENFRFSAEHCAEGVYDFSVGLAKKVLIADKLGQAVDAGYLRVADLTTGEAWLVMLCYTLQIYFDFSGYCDMASGIAKMFHFSLPVNFDSPYKSKSIPEFWQRWHITLGRFLKNYIYYPLGGNRKGRVRTYINLMVVFLVSGLWHGANWTFVLWGALHGVFSCLYRAGHKVYDGLFGWVRCLITFFIVNIGWVLFRAESISQAVDFYRRMFTWSGFGIDSEISIGFHITGMNRLINLVLPFRVGSGVTLAIEAVLGVIVFTLIVFATKNLREQTNKQSFRKAVISSVFLVLSVLSFSNVSAFLYFNF